MEAARAEAPKASPEINATPATMCDIVLDAAISSDADTIWFEPQLPQEDRYDVSIERQGRVIAAVSLDGALGAAVIARLAMLAEVDLIARRGATGRCTVRGPSSSAEIVVTTRPGRTLRAEVTVKKHSPRPVTTAEGPVTLAKGTVVGQYRILEPLGAGGMGQVFRATHTTLGRHYAVKVLNADARSSDPESAARFLREARAAARIKHPHIVDVFDFGYLADGRPYLVMELLDGQSLAAEVATGALEPRIAISMARQLASALRAAHAVGVIHADVSPSNILVTGETAKLVDFGLAQLLDDPARLSGEPAEFVFGTPSYIAPEMIRGMGADAKSDQYSLGIVMFEMLTGSPPFKAKTIRDLCIMHLKAGVPELLSPHGALPPEVVKVVNRCLAKQPAQRFESMIELDAALVEAEQALFVRGWRRWLTP
jgi:eukaryotic-like serine/threonine-protein kinase